MRRRIEKTDADTKDGSISLRIDSHGDQNSTGDRLSAMTNLLERVSTIGYDMFPSVRSRQDRTSESSCWVACGIPSNPCGISFTTLVRSKEFH
jgi:hypothetical protein